MEGGPLKPLAAPLLAHGIRIPVIFGAAALIVVGGMGLLMLGHMGTLEKERAQEAAESSARILAQMTGNILVAGHKETLAAAVEDVVAGHSAVVRVSIRDAEGRFLHRMARGSRSEDVIRVVEDVLREPSRRLWATVVVEADPEVYRAGAADVRRRMARSIAAAVALMAALATVITRTMVRRSARSESLYRALFHDAGEGVLLYEAESLALMEANPLADDLLPLLDAQGAEVDEFLGRCARTGDSERRDLVCGDRVLLLRAAEIRLPEGHAVRLAVRDVTIERIELRRQEQEARLEGLGLIAGGIAHDFNNVLAGILPQAERILDAAAEEDPARDPARAIVEAAERGTQMVQRLLRFHGGGGEPDRVPVDSAALLTELAGILETRFPEGLEMSLDLRATWIRGDAALVAAAVDNVLVNAAEAMGGQGLISVTARPNGDELLIEVEDSGPGLSTAAIDSLFDPLFTTKAGGHGLGLPFARASLRSMGGDLEAHPARTGGLLVRFRLPAMPEQEASPDVGAVETGRGGTTVLVAEDDEGVRRLITETLVSSGYRVLEAKDGLEAVALFDANAGEIALAVLDLRMPGLHGTEVLERIRALRPGLPVVATSAYAQGHGGTARLEELGVTSFLPKPFHLGELLGAAESALA